MWTYALSGLANRDTFPASGPSRSDGTQHPASIITLSALYDPTGVLPAPLADPTYFFVRSLSIGGGRTARVSSPKSGYGPYRVEWVQGGEFYAIIGTRGFTSDGKSGVPLSQLVKMAESVG